MVDILGIGTSGLMAYRKLLETVGGNITNANTEGYVRRDVVLSGAGDSAMLPTSTPSTSGSGVTVDMVRRASDAFLQVQALKANSLSMQSQTLADSLTQIEKTLFATTSNPGTIVQDFYSRFNDVANAPTSAAARISVLDSGKQVASVFTQAAASISDSLGAVRSGLDAALTAVNGLTSQLGLLNVQIQSTATSGQKPNDLLDQRDKLLTSLSNLANFTYVEQSSGAITVYLGDTPSGRPLVYANGSHPLGVSENSDKLDVVMDPNSAPAPTNQLTSGTVAGLLDYRAQVALLRDDINRLAVGFSIAVNEQHKQGVDLNGQPGTALFSTDGLNAVGAKNNLGDAKLSLTIDNAASIDNVTYTARFNQGENTWTVKSSAGKTVTATNNLSMGGVSFTFDGQAKDGDTFTVSPLLGAASSMRFLVTRPAEVAVALPLYVDPSPTNTGTADLRPVKQREPDPAALIPLATTVFDSANPVNDFLKNGAAFMLPAGASAATLTSLANVSAVHFTATGSQISALRNADEEGLSRLSLSIFVNGAKKDLALSPHGTSLNDVADAINAEAERKANGDPALDPTLRDAFYASVANGTLTITALTGKTVANAALIGAGFNARSGAPNQVLGTNEAGSSAAIVRVFTRDGRQLSGPELSEAEGRAFVTQANGFLSDAVYNKNYLSVGYPRINAVEAEPLLATENFDTSISFLNTSAKIDVSTQPSYDLPQAGYGQETMSGAVYALNVDGLKPIRLAGDSLIGAGPSDVATALAANMNAQAARVAWLGAPINFTDDMSSQIAFNISVDGSEPPRTITFQRSQEPRNLKLRVTGDVTGVKEITIDKPSGSSNGINWTHTNGRLQVSKGSNATITIEPLLDYQALGFVGGESGPSVTASKDSSLMRETGSFDLGGVTDLQVSLVTGAAGDTYNVTRLQVALQPNSVAGQTIQLTNADGTQVLATKTLTSAEATLGFATFDRPLTGSDDVAQLQAFQIIQGERQHLSKLQLALQPNSVAGQTIQLTNADGTQVLATRTLTSAEAAVGFATFDGSLIGSADVAQLKAFQIIAGVPQALSTPAVIISPMPPTQISWAGESRILISVPQKLRTTAPAISVTPVSVSQVGALDLETIGLTDGVPTTTSVTSPADLLSSLLASTKPELYVTGTTLQDQTIQIDAPSGSQNGVSWNTVDGKLTLSSNDQTMMFNRSSLNDAAARQLGFDPTQIYPPTVAETRIIDAGTKMIDALLNAKQPEISIKTGVGDGQRPYSIKINASSGYDAKSGVNWKVQDGKLSFITGSSALQISGDHQTKRSAAMALGFNGTDLDLNVESTVTSANKLTLSLLAEKKPTLQVKGNQIGAQTLTIDRPNGSYNGVNWSLYQGKLTLSSTDPTLQIDTATTDTRTMANALGFTGAQVAGSPIIAKETVAKSMVGLGAGLQFTVSTDETGGIPLTINSLSGTNAASGVSWSYNETTDKLTLSSIHSSFRVAVSATGSRNAQALGFLGDGADKKIEAARISLTSTASDRTKALANSSATISHVGQSISFDGGIPEDLVVDVKNASSDGLRRIAARVDMAPAPPRPLRPDLQIKILDGGKLEIFDPASGASLATRSWQQDIPVNYLGMSFTIHGNANVDDVYTIRNDSTRTSDNRNALLMAELATTSIFGRGQGSFQDVYAGVTSRLGSAVQASNTRAGATIQAASDLKAAYEGKTGVNLDREAADLIRYQQAYQAAAQIIMAARDMFATILKSF